MRYFAAFWSGPKHGRELVPRARAAFIARFGAPDVVREFPHGMVLVAGIGPAPNCGVMETDEAIRVLPYRLNTTDGVSHDLASARTRTTVDRFLEAAPATVAAPFVAIELTARSLTIAQDFIGSGRCFVHRSSHLVVATNSVLLGQDCLGRSLDEEALASFAACGWVAGDRTFNRSFFLPRPNERLTARPGVFGLKVTSRTDGPTPSSFPDTSLSDLGEALTGLARSISGSLQGQSLTLSLSGGRDSRLMAAIFSGIVPVEYRTINRYDDETATVKRLVSLIGQENRLRVEPAERGEDGAQRTDDIVAQARWLVRTFDGLHEPAYIGRKKLAGRDPLIVASQAGTQTISGAAGEMAHGHYYPARGDVERFDTDASIRHLSARLRGINIVRDATRRAFDAELRSRLRKAGPHRNGVRVLDHFYLYERQRRWSSFSTTSNIVAPMANAMFALGSFTFPVPDITESRVHRDLTAALVPAWSEVPYFKASAGQPSNVANLPSEAVRRAIDMAASHDPLRRIIDVDRMRSTLIDEWDVTSPALRDAVSKRLLWLAAVAEEFA